VDASLEALRHALASAPRHQIRVDSHGDHDEQDVRRSWLRLSDVVLDPAGLRALDLSTCGTLILAACESGMTHRTRRDDRLGFVRAAFLAGASSVLAARWAAENKATDQILDAFQRHLRHLPRDVALRRAQLEFLSRPDRHDGIPDPRHPSRWACWTLYGDAALQTAAGRFRRAARSLSPRSPRPERA
jgi:CHAT domain-containing protein